MRPHTTGAGFGAAGRFMLSSPSFADSISPEDAWALVAYVRSLRRGD
jgi:hypothetical protein